MAKHQVGKTVSKKSSISCKGNVKRPAAIIVQAERIGNAMREAFLSIHITNNINKIRAGAGKAPIVDAILTCAKRNVGNPHAGRGWSANLSPRTVKQLTEQGVFG